MCTYFTTETDAAQNLVDDFFFKLWLLEDPSIGRILSEKKYGGTGLLSEKTEVLHAEINEKLEEPPAVILQKSIFYNIFIQCLWLRIIARSD